MIDKPKKKQRIAYGPFRIWEDGYIAGAGYINLVRRKSERVRLSLSIYENGRYPYFPKNKKVTGYLMELPKPALVDLVKRINKNPVRVRHRKENTTWHIKKYNDLIEYDMALPVKSEVKP